ncbi:MAG: C40 family peptidase [Bacteroidaceae bacterium]|nr:C40 family peptidase [Bacteroidaceae bacterium]
MSLQAYNEAIEAKTNTAAIANSDDVSGETIVKTAMQYIGVPYRHGTSSPKSFDCSGFTSFVYRQFDINLSRDSRAQYTQGQIIKNKSDLRAGDLVFFQGSSGRGGVGHVGIVTEVNPSDMTFKFVHASSKKGVTTEQSTTAYYNQRYVGARRVLQNIDE